MAPRTLPLAEVAEVLHPSDSLAVPLGPGIPAGFLHALATRKDWVDLRIFGALLIDLFEVLTHPNVHFTSGFFGPAERLLRDSGADVQFMPADFRRFAPILEVLRPRVMATVATPPDAEGWCSLSVHAGATVDALHACGADPGRVLIVEANANFPRTMGLLPEHGHRLHVDEIDVLVESDQAPLDLQDPVPTDADRIIARFALDFISDGCTLQTGIGGIPSAVASMLAELPGGDYGIHSEMFTTGIMRLHQAGKVSNARKGIYDGFTITTFAAGIPELYPYLDGNPDVRFLPVDVVNSPTVIAANRAMVMINGAVAIDLAGQVAADTVGPRQYSGIGGAEDFAMPSGLQVEDRSLICLPSTATVEGRRVSRIQPVFDAGTVVTTPRHQVDVVITEFGTAELRGRTVRQRARALAAIAHPDFRDAALEAAERADA
jgi:acyl-CoA hydrolase